MKRREWAIMADISQCRWNAKLGEGLVDPEVAQGRNL